MKKIVITGHTSGIGQAIYNYFSKDSNNEVFGFSRSTGFNIKEPAKRNEIIEFSKDADIFVNNAHAWHDDSQLIMLRNMFNAWEGQNKIIINTSSIAPAQVVQTTYSLLKGGLDDFCFSRVFRLPHIINLKPSYVMVENLKREIGNQKFMTTDQVIEVLDFCMKSPVKIREITFLNV
jgi:NAD(P)-dependent dehydrogenase (short-subunit alcohol dehydrogenase family)